ncbi:MAG: HEAT repeat domain-containing protein [Bilophila sp.]
MPSRFRALKSDLRIWLQAPDWEASFAKLDAVPRKELLGPLLSCLPLGGTMTKRAAVAFGRVVATLAQESPEEARNVVRRLMWHMNEESGNIGWGIPEAFAEVLAHSRTLADAFHPILFSYITKTGREDNYCDHDALRCSCYNAVTRLATARQDLAQKARPLLQAGLLDPDPACRTAAREGLEAIGVF